MVRKNGKRLSNKSNLSGRPLDYRYIIYKLLLESDHRFKGEQPVYSSRTSLDQTELINISSKKHISKLYARMYINFVSLRVTAFFNVYYSIY